MGRRSHLHARIALILASLLLVASGCLGTGGKARSLEEYAQYQQVETGETLGARVNEFALRFEAITETAADEIIARSRDPQVRKAALVWKVEGIPVCHLACFRPNPLGGLYDVWVLCAQFRDYFVEGEGKGSFGDEQQIAVKASETLLSEADAMAREALRDLGTFDTRFAEVRAIARELPLRSPISSRSTALWRLARYAPSEQGAMATLATVELQLRVFERRLHVYAQHLPKQARWQGQLLATEILEGSTVSGASRSLIALDDHVGSVDKSINALEAATRQQVGLILEAVTVQMRNVTDNIAVQRVEGLKAVAQERIAALEAFDASLKRAVSQTLSNIDDRADRALTWLATSAVVALVLLALLVWAVARRRVLRLDVGGGGTATPLAIDRKSDVGELEARGS